jgi:hypothetical protein
MAPFTAILVGLAGTGSEAFADPLTWSWGSIVTTRNFGGEDGTFGDYVADRSGAVSLWLGVAHIPPSGLAFTTSGKWATLNASNLWAVLPPDSRAVYHFDPSTSWYHLGLAFANGDQFSSPIEGWVDFSGYFSGSLSLRHPALVNTFTSPTTQTVQIGAHDFTVKVRYQNEGVTAQDMYTGAILANVTVSPEPPGLLLATLGLCGVVLVAWRRKLRPVA